jgi:hypothetical protein
VHALFILGEISVIDPLEAVRGDLPIRSFIAATASGLRAVAVAIANTVTGNFRAVNIFHSRQNPTREPNS